MFQDLSGYLVPVHNRCIAQYKGSRLEVRAPATIPYFLQEQIRGLIVDGSFRPGQPLREQELEQRFGTSRSPIREALRLLELGGLVTHVQRKGFRVRLYGAEEIRHLYMLRAELEAYAIKQVADMKELSALVAEMYTHDEGMSVARAKSDVRAYIIALREFYLTFARFTGNAPLLDVLGRIYEQVEPLRYLLATQSIDAGVAELYTRGVVEAMGRRNFESAAQLTRSYVRELLPSVLESYQAAVSQVEHSRKR